jgi:hypothetical protein
MASSSNVRIMPIVLASHHHHRANVSGKWKDTPDYEIQSRQPSGSTSRQRHVCRRAADGREAPFPTSESSPRLARAEPVRPRGAAIRARLLGICSWRSEDRTQTDRATRQQWRSGDSLSRPGPPLRSPGSVARSSRPIRWRFWSSKHTGGGLACPVEPGSVPPGAALRAARRQGARTAVVRALRRGLEGRRP